MRGKARSIVAILGLLILTVSAAAQNYPSRVIKLLHGFPPGGGVDVLARIVSDEMSKSLGQPIVVEARSGAFGTLAAEAVARSAPDGYTLLFVPSAHAISAAVLKSIKYNAVDDFAWISPVSFYPFVLNVRKDSPIKSIGDLLQRARAHPGGLAYGSTGLGTGHYMTVELLAHATNTKFVNVSYRGEGQIITGLLDEEIDFGPLTLTIAVPQIKSGALRALGVTSKKRWPVLPDVPTFQEAGVPDYEVISWTGFAAPAGTPRAIIDRLNAEVRRAISAPLVEQRLESLGQQAEDMTPEEMKALVARQVAMWRELVDEAKIETQ